MEIYLKVIKESCQNSRKHFYVQHTDLTECLGDIFWTTNSAKDVIDSSVLYFPKRRFKYCSNSKGSFLIRSEIPMQLPACSIALLIISSLCSDANKCCTDIEISKSGFKKLKRDHIYSTHMKNINVTILRKKATELIGVSKQCIVVKNKHKLKHIVSIGSLKPTQPTEITPQLLRVWLSPLVPNSMLVSKEEPKPMEVGGDCGVRVPVSIKAALS